MPDYFDIHSHLNFPQFDADREQVILELKDKKIWTITVGTGLSTSQEAIELAEHHEHLFAIIGLHPADNVKESLDIAAFEKIIVHPKVVAVGECGLDYFRMSGEVETLKKKQKDYF